MEGEEGKQGSDWGGDSFSEYYDEDGQECSDAAQKRNDKRLLAAGVDRFELLGFERQRWQQESGHAVLRKYRAEDLAIWRAQAVHRERVLHPQRQEAAKQLARATAEAAKQGWTLEQAQAREALYALESEALEDWTTWSCGRMRGWLKHRDGTQLQAEAHR